MAKRKPAKKGANKPASKVSNKSAARPSTSEAVAGEISPTTGEQRSAGRKPAADRPTAGTKSRAAAGGSNRHRAADRRRRARHKNKAKETAIVIGVTLVIGFFAAWSAKGWIEEKRLIASVDQGACKFDTQTDPGVTGEHSTAATFKVNPPSGGVHFPTNAVAGDYTGGNIPADGQIVHSHEHGYVVLWYRPGDTATLDKLRDIYREHTTDVLIVPRESLPTPVAATAWGKRLLCTSTDASKLNKFTEFYIGKGPEKVPRG